MPTLTNFTYDEITIGQTATYTKTCTEQDLLLFAAVSGDLNPVHLDEEFASKTRFKGRIAHGMYTAGLISAALALELPGPGSVYLGQNLKFQHPVTIGDEITVELTVTEKTDKRQTLTLETIAKNQSGKTVVSGTATVMAPPEKLSIEAKELPTISLG